MRRAGKAPLYRGQPGYRPGLDRDRDGVACEGSNGGTGTGSDDGSGSDDGTGTGSDDGTGSGSDDGASAEDGAPVVTEPVARSTSGSLPYTGTPVAVLLALGAALLIGGGTLVLVGRRH